MYAKSRFYIPMVSPYLKLGMLQDILKHTLWIGFNIFELKHSKFYDNVKSKGLKDAFGINDDVKVFLTSITKDQNLINFFGHPNWLKEFRSDIMDFNVDMAMGPDWFSYKEDSFKQRKANIKKAIELNMGLLDLENVAPPIRGTSLEEFRSFVAPFKAQGKTFFIFAGREYLINLGDRKKAQLEFSSLTSVITQLEKVRLVVTGCNSPKLMETLPTVSGFSGLGWLIQSRQRRLIMGKTYLNIFDPKFFCNDNGCCAAISKKDLKNPENDSIRAIHNLRRINANLGNISEFSQAYLGDFDGTKP
jgi:hypothetical protein